MIAHPLERLGPVPAPTRARWGRLRRVWTLLMVTCGALAGAAAPARAESPSEDESVALPPYIVEAFERPLTWRFLEVPGVEMLSVCDEDVAAGFLRRYFLLEQQLRQILPVEFQAQSSVPTAIILFNNDLNRMHSREVIAEMLDKEGAQAMTDEALASARDLRLPSWMDRRTTFLPDLRLSDVDAVLVFAAVDEEAGPTDFRFTLEPAWISYLMEHRVPRLPPWLITGIEGVYRDATLNDDGITLNRALWISESETRAFVSRPDRPRELLPMADLFARRHVESTSTDSETDALWRAQCMLLVRWALVAHDGAHREALWAFLRGLEHQAPDEALFARCFGFGFADARDRLSDYLPKAVSEREVLRAPTPIVAPPIRPRPATAAEVARIRGDWERLEIGYVVERFPQLTSRYADQARRTVRKAYDRGERDPRLLAVMGLLECDADNPGAARYYLEAAAQAGVRRPRVYTALAQLRLPEELATSPDHKLAPDQLARVLGLLDGALALDPPLAETYRLYAEACVVSREPLQPAHLAVLDQGVGRFPDYSSFVFRVVAMHANLGHRERAAELARTGLRHATDPAAIELFKRALAQLAASPPK